MLKEAVGWASGDDGGSPGDDPEISGGMEGKGQ
jgi:hypothetical protein